MNTLCHKKKSAMESGEASRRREARLQANTQHKSVRERVLALTLLQVQRVFQQNLRKRPTALSRQLSYAPLDTLTTTLLTPAARLDTVFIATI